MSGGLLFQLSPVVQPACYFNRLVHSSPTLSALPAFTMLWR
jgi:hypothetical protein